MIINIPALWSKSAASRWLLTRETTPLWFSWKLSRSFVDSVLSSWRLWSCGTNGFRATLDTLLGWLHCFKEVPSSLSIRGSCFALRTTCRGLTISWGLFWVQTVFKDCSKPSEWLVCWTICSTSFTTWATWLCASAIPGTSTRRLWIHYIQPKREWDGTWYGWSSHWCFS